MPPKRILPIGLIALYSCASATTFERIELERDSKFAANTQAEVRNHPWYHRRHHFSRQGFRNIWGTENRGPGLKRATWIAGRGFASPEGKPARFRPLDPRAIARDRTELRAWWLGHATVLTRLGGRTILTDPHFTKRSSPVDFAGPKRLVALPLTVQQLPPIDIVVISHDHYDHTDIESLRQVYRARRPLFVVPLRMARMLRSWGIERVVELDWWQYVDIQGVRITCTPAKHNSGRSLWGKNYTLWAGWHFEDRSSRRSMFYASDTGYGPHFNDIRRRLGAPDLAILPIGAYKPRWFMKEDHMDAREAVKAMEVLAAKSMLPVHWGTFHLADEPLHEPPRIMKAELRKRGIALKRADAIAVGQFLDGNTLRVATGLKTQANSK